MKRDANATLSVRVHGSEHRLRRPEARRQIARWQPPYHQCANCLHHHQIGCRIPARQVRASHSRSTVEQNASAIPGTW